MQWDIRSFARLVFKQNLWCTLALPVLLAIGLFGTLGSGPRILGTLAVIPLVGTPFAVAIYNLWNVISAYVRTGNRQTGYGALLILAQLGYFGLMLAEVELLVAAAFVANIVGLIWLRDTKPALHPEDADPGTGADSGTDSDTTLDPLPQVVRRADK